MLQNDNYANRVESGMIIIIYYDAVIPGIIIIYYDNHSWIIIIPGLL